MKNFFLLFLISLSFFVVASSSRAETRTLLWNGESGSFVGQNGALNSSQPHTGRFSFEGSPTGYNPPVVRMIGLSTWRVNLSNYDEIQFYAKTTKIGTKINFYVNAWNGKSNVVDIDQYIEGGKLDTTYRLVRVPISVLKNSTYRLEIVESFYFGTSNPDHKIYIDDIYAVGGSGAAIVSNNTTSQNQITSDDSLGVSFKTKTTLWDGESGLSSSANGVLSSQAHAGRFSFEGSPTYSPPVVRMVGLSTWRINLSSYDEIQFYAKTTLPGKKVNFYVNAWNGKSNVIDLNQYIEGGKLDTTYRLVRVPISALKNTNYKLATVESFYFSTAKLAGYKIYIDDISAVGNNVVAPVVVKPVSPNNNPTTTMDVVYDPVDPIQAILPPAGQIVGVNNITSNSADLSFRPASSAKTIKIYVAPEPTAESNGALKKQKLVATIPASTPAYRLDRLAASADAFVRVENLDEAGKVLAGANLHVRTLGGPRAKLATPLREVHMVSPNILELVFENKNVYSYSANSADNNAIDNGATSLIGSTGPSLQAGPWNITRADGKKITVNTVYRHSIPVWMSDITKAGRIDVDHHIYLVLSESIGQSEVLNIKGPKNTDIILPFSDNYLETTVIQLNQVGYSPKASRRYAYVSAWLGDGGGLSLANFPATAEVLIQPADPLQLPSRALSGLNITTRSGLDTDANAPVKEINLSGLTSSDSAVYRVKIPGVGVSWPTRVSNKAVGEAFGVVVKGLYFNRWGRALQQPWTNLGPRPADHPLVYTSESTNFLGENAAFTAKDPKVGERPLSGGHHDAADNDQRVFHFQVPMMLMRAYEMNPKAFRDGQTNIPESGNGIPDLLDEALYNLKGWAQLQEADGGVRAGVESYAEGTNTLWADQQTQTYWTWAREPYHTMRMAALFAQAARLVAPFDKAKSADLTDRAIRAYNYAYGHGVTESSKGGILFATGELYRLTGDKKYQAMFEKVWLANVSYGKYAPGIVTGLYQPAYFLAPVQPILSDFVVDYWSGAGVNTTYRDQSVAKLKSLADQSVVAVDNSHAHRNGRPAGWDPTWGQGMISGRYVRDIWNYFQMANPTDRQKYIDAISLSADFMLGGNPSGMIYVTGLGSRHTEYPLHFDSDASIRAGGAVAPGISVFGPVGAVPNRVYYDFGLNTFYPAFSASPIMLRYADLPSFVRTNEFSVHETMAPNSELLGVLYGLGN
ncbi:MAG: glycoside hydrolase family 9 protein [Candidatus Paceibacterota bacterium]